MENCMLVAGKLYKYEKNKLKYNNIITISGTYVAYSICKSVNCFLEKKKSVYSNH